MTRSVYILGGAGTGKSTFTAELLSPWDLGPLEVFHEEPLIRGKGRPAMIKVRGHVIEEPGGDVAPVPIGFYLGQMRAEFPGTDGLDRVCGPAVNAWLRGGDLPPFIVAEGALLANPRQLPVLAEETELLILHFTVDEMIADLRFLARGSSQASTYVATTVTKSAKMARLMRESGVEVLDVDTEDPWQWQGAILDARRWLLRG